METGQPTAPEAFLHGAVPEGAQLPPPVPAKRGRPSIFSPEIADKICERVAGGETLRKVCADPEMPHRGTVYRWLDENARFRLAYSYAAIAKVEGLAEECIEIADGTAPQFPSGEDESVSRSELRIETRKWLAKVSMPKKYGEPPAIAGPAVEAAPAPQQTLIAGQINLINVHSDGPLPPIPPDHPLKAELEAYEQAATA